MQAANNHGNYNNYQPRLMWVNSYGVPSLPYGNPVYEGYDSVGYWCQVRDIMVPIPGRNGDLLNIVREVFRLVPVPPVHFAPPQPVQVHSSMAQPHDRVPLPQEVLSPPSRHVAQSEVSAAGLPPQAETSSSSSSSAAAAAAAAAASSDTSVRSSASAPSSASARPMMSDDVVGRVIVDSAKPSNPFRASREDVETIVPLLKPAAPWSCVADTLKMIKIKPAAAESAESPRASTEREELAICGKAPEKPVKNIGEDRITRNSDPLNIGTRYLPEQFRLSGKDHMYKRLQFFYSLCNYLEQNRDSLAGMRVLPETWADTQYNPAYFQIEGAKEYQNAHISLFPRILLQNGGQKLQLSDRPVSILFENGGERKTTMHRLLNICDAAPRILNDVDNLMENGTGGNNGARQVAAALFNDIIAGKRNSEDAEDAFAEFYQYELKQVLGRLHAEKAVNPYRYTACEDIFAYAVQEKANAKKVIEGMLESLTKV